MTKSVFYLHGFCSSPGSNKATFLRRRLAERGIDLRVPDLNAPDFSHLTLTAQLERVADEVRACPPGDVYLIGSSMGGAVAVHFMDRYREAEGQRVAKLLLLAPAFDFWENRLGDLGEEQMERWQREGFLPFFHYAYNEARPVHYGLMEDLARYDGFAVQIDIPVIIFHGLNDRSVNYQQSVRFALGKQNVTVKLVNSDHEMRDQVELILDTAAEFFGL